MAIEYHMIVSKGSVNYTYLLFLSQKLLHQAVIYINPTALHSGMHPEAIISVHGLNVNCLQIKQFAN